MCKVGGPKGDGALSGIGDHDEVGDVDDQLGKVQKIRDVDLDGRSTEEGVASTRAGKEDQAFSASLAPKVGYNISHYRGTVWFALWTSSPTTRSLSSYICIVGKLPLKIVHVK